MGSVRKVLQDCHRDYEIGITDPVFGGKANITHIKYSEELIKFAKKGLGFHTDADKGMVAYANDGTVHVPMLVSLILDHDCRGGDLVVLKDGALKRDLRGFGIPENPEKTLKGM